MVSSMGKPKVVFLPLDERPCNYQFPTYLFKESKLEIIKPPLKIMGKQKKGAQFESIKNFLIANTQDAYGLVISLDTLCYGGIVPSRLHHFDVETLKSRLYLLRTLKENNPNLKIYGFSLIMRCPQYNSALEEPDYFDICGEKIFRKGFYEHKLKLNIISDEEKEKLSNLNIPQQYLDDFLTRRNKNLKINLESIDLLKAKIIDFLIIPQDDSAEYGYTANDQDIVRSKVFGEKLMFKALMYPGADEVGLVLLSRMQNDYSQKQPKVYIKYPAITSPTVIPCLEDRYLDTTIRYQVLASGGIVVPAICDCDIILVVFIGAHKMIPNPYPQKKPRDVSVLANYLESEEFIKYYIDKKPIMIADLTYLNGGSIELLEFIINNNIQFQLGGYAGWNTAANSLGTVISQGFNFLINNNTLSHKEFLLRRYLEDIGYCSIVRQEVGEKYKNINNQEIDKVESMVKERLVQFSKNYFPNINYQLSNVYLPWKRLFEVGFEVQL